MEHEYFECQCVDLNHLVRFTLDHKDGEVWLEIRPSQYLSFHKRVWFALKYVLGLSSVEHYYDISMLREEDYDRLRDFLKQSELAKAGDLARRREQAHKK